MHCPTGYSFSSASPLDHPSLVSSLRHRSSLVIAAAVGYSSITRRSPASLPSILILLLSSPFILSLFLSLIFSFRLAHGFLNFIDEEQPSNVNSRHFTYTPIRKRMHTNTRSLVLISFYFSVLLALALRFSIERTIRN